MFYIMYFVFRTLYTVLTRHQSTQHVLFLPVALNQVPRCVDSLPDPSIAAAFRPKLYLKSVFKLFSV